MSKQTDRYDSKWTYDAFKKLYASNPSYFQKKKGALDSISPDDYYQLAGAAGQQDMTVLSTSLFDKFSKQYADERFQAEQQAKAAEVNGRVAGQSAQDGAIQSAQANAAQSAQSQAEIAKIQEQLAAATGAGGTGSSATTSTDQLVEQYQKQMKDYQDQLANSQSTLFNQLAKQQAEQQQKATDMFGGYQQYTDQLKNEWQTGLTQTKDLISTLQSGYQSQLQGLQGIFNQSLEESRAARQTETDERARIQGLLQEQAKAAQQAKENQDRFQQSAEMIASKKQKDLGRSFNRATSQASFGVLSNLRRRSGASQAVFGDGTTSQNPYGYSDIFFS